MSEQIDSSIPWAESTAPIMGDGWVQFGGEGGKKVYFDKLTKADQDLIIQYLLSAQFPILAAPQIISVSSEGNQVEVISAASVNSEQKRHEIVMAMLDTWLVNIQKMAELNKRNDEKIALERIDTAYREFKHQEGQQSDKISALFAAGLIIVTTAILPGTTLVNPIVSMYNHVLAPVVGNIGAGLGMTGAIFAAGITYFSMAQVVAGVKGSSKPSETALAKSYAENVLNLISDQSFNQYLMAIVVRSVPKGLDPKRVEELTAMIKLVLLSSSLAMLYQAEAGRMTGAEFAGMLNHTISFPETDVRAKLVELIHANLKLMNLKDREKVLAALLEYFDSDPTVASLSDPSKVFAGLYEKLPRGELAG